MKFANGDIYEGQFENGLRHGNGTLKFANGKNNVYVGEFKNDKFEGKGILTVNDNIYEGPFLNGLLQNGFGYAKMANGDIYEGQFENGLPKKGSLKFANGKKNM